MSGGESDENDDLVTAVRARGEEFCLTEKDLSALIVTHAPNPHYRRAAPMRLYRRSDLLAAARKKHGGDDGIRRAVRKRAERSAKARNTREAKKDDRRGTLEAALAEQGLRIRSDSFLCDNYLKHGETPQWSLQTVVRRMAQMKFLHEYTRYQWHMGNIRQEYRDMGDRYEVEELRGEAEHRALRDVHGWPMRWPWLPPWSPEAHRSFPTPFKERVKTLILCMQRYTHVTSDILKKIVSSAAKDI